MYDFIKFDADQVRADAVNAYEEASGGSLMAGDERLILIDTFVYNIASVLAANANYMANQQLKATAESPYLEMLGEDDGIIRRGATASYVMIRFSLSFQYQYDINIPRGTRVTPNGQVFFAAEKDLVIPAGELYVESLCKSTTTGADTAGIMPGSINILVDVIPEISSVANVAPSYGGADIEDIEDYRDRILSGRSSFSTAGPAEAYRYHVLRADPRVLDAQIEKSEEGDQYVCIYILAHDDFEDVKKQILKALSSDVVPLTDIPIVRQAEQEPYRIRLEYKIDPGDLRIKDDIDASIQKAISDYVDYIESGIGRGVNPDEIRKRALNAGACTVDLLSPTSYIATGKKTAKSTGAPIISYTGTITGGDTDDLESFGG